MADFIKVAGADEIAPGQMRSYSAGDRNILITNYAGRYYAIDSRCTHMGGDLSKGTLEDNIVKCPRHGSRFDVTSGKNISGPKLGPFKIRVKDVRSYEIIVENNEIKVKI
jgi:3-phenylpropionate/trans-cinnamate dioxygenase ferredoxin subunit